MRAILNGDLVTGVVDGDTSDGVEISDALTDVPAGRLRFDGKNVIDAGTLSTFFIDANGVKHAVDGAGLQALACKFDDNLVLVGSAWRVKDAAARLQEAKAALARRVDALAEAKRLTMITPGVGQAMVYMQKFAEAQRASGDANPTPANYPLLAASVGVDGPTISAVAQKVIQTFTAWVTAAAAIERSRLKAKADVAAAANEASAGAVVSGLTL